MGTAGSSSSTRRCSEQARRTALGTASWIAHERRALLLGHQPCLVEHSYDLGVTGRHRTEVAPNAGFTRPRPAAVASNPIDDA